MHCFQLPGVRLFGPLALVLPRALSLPAFRLPSNPPSLPSFTPTFLRAPSDPSAPVTGLPLCAPAVPHPAGGAVGAVGGGGVVNLGAGHVATVDGPKSRRGLLDTGEATPRGPPHMQAQREGACRPRPTGLNAAAAKLVPEEKLRAASRIASLV